MTKKKKRGCTFSTSAAVWTLRTSWGKESDELSSSMCEDKASPVF